MKIASAFSGARVQAMVAAGAGAVAAGFAQQALGDSMPELVIGSRNVRDVLLTGVAVVGAAWGGEYVRPASLGFGGMAVGSLIQRNVIATLIPE